MEFLRQLLNVLEQIVHAVIDAIIFLLVLLK